jgi:ABC-2 type transport system permease protein
MVARYARFLVAYVRLNLSAAMEYRVSFIAQSLGMVLNDAVFFIFWVIYFARFSDVGGWGMRDVALVWSVSATAIGLSVALLGNCTRLATLIVHGQLDYYLALPKAPLPHVLVSRMGLGGWGDVCFGLLAYVVFGYWDPASVLLYIVVVLCSMLVFVSFMVLAGSLAFFIGSAEAAANQAFMGIITFSVYPGAMFNGWVKVLIFTAIPAAFISHVPVQLLQSFDALLLLALVAFTALSLAVAGFVFHVGLRRYESGNLVTMRA